MLPFSLSQLTSVGAIIACTIILMQAVMRSPLATTNGFKHIPVCAYYVLVAAGLTFVANVVTKTLPGDTLSLMFDAIIKALAASGALQFMTNEKSTLATFTGNTPDAAGETNTNAGNGASVVKSLAFMFIGFALVTCSIGCTNNAKLITVREGLAGAADAPMVEYSQWINEKETSGAITHDSATIKRNSVKAFNDLLSQSRAADGNADPTSIFSKFFSAPPATTQPAK